MGEAVFDQRDDLAAVLSLCYITCGGVAYGLQRYADQL